MVYLLSRISDIMEEIFWICDNCKSLWNMELDASGCWRKTFVFGEFPWSLVFFRRMVAALDLGSDLSIVEENRFWWERRFDAITLPRFYCYANTVRGSYAFWRARKRVMHENEIKLFRNYVSGKHWTAGWEIRWPDGGSFWRQVLTFAFERRLKWPKRSWLIKISCKLCSFRRRLYWFDS